MSYYRILLCPGDFKNQGSRLINVVKTMFMLTLDCWASSIKSQCNGNRSTRKMRTGTERSLVADRSSFALAEIVYVIHVGVCARIPFDPRAADRDNNEQIESDR